MILFVRRKLMGCENNYFVEIFNLDPTVSSRDTLTFFDENDFRGRMTTIRVI